MHSWRIIGKKTERKRGKNPSIIYQGLEREGERKRGRGGGGGGGSA